MTTLADEFNRTDGKPIVYDGRTLTMSFSLQVEQGDRVDVIFERFAPSPVQGLRLALKEKGGQLEIGKQRSTDFVLWTDTAPRHVQVLIAKGKRKGHLVLWNVWRDAKHGTTLYGVNNAAIEVAEQSATGAVLRCSDGWLGPDFDDLVVRLGLLPKDFK
jgi:hypothetical protein